MKPNQLLSLLAVLLASPATAQTPANPATDAAPEPVPQVILTPVQTEHILKELEKVESQIGKGRGSIFNAAMTKFREGMASPAAAMALYLDCYKLEHYERKNLKQTDFIDWRNRNEDRLKDEDFKQALLLQLEYLVLSIQAQDINESKKMAPLVTSLQTFLGKAITAIQGATVHSASGAVTNKDATKDSGQGGGRRGGGGGGGNVVAGDILGTLKQSVAESDFAKAFSVGDFLKREDWEYQPLNVKGIYKSVILPYYLAEKPGDLPAQWDTRINAEVAMRKALLSETEFNEYNKDAGPRMLWEKNNYLVAKNVTAVNALADMLKVIQNYPSHPDAKAWLKDFRELVVKVSVPIPGTPPAEKPIGSQ